MVVVGTRYLAKILAPEGSKEVAVGHPIAITVSVWKHFVQFCNFLPVKCEMSLGEDWGPTIFASFEIETKKIWQYHINFLVGLPNCGPWFFMKSNWIHVKYLPYLLFYKVEDASDIEAIKNSVNSSSTNQQKAPQHDTKSEVKAQKTKIARISPAAKLLIAEYGLDASTLNATGHYGTLLKGDVLSEIKSGKLSPKPASPKEKVLSSQSHQQVAASRESKSNLGQSDSYEDFPNSQIRKVGLSNISYLWIMFFNSFSAYYMVMRTILPKRDSEQPSSGVSG